jgi:hypothetical protein
MQKAVDRLKESRKQAEEHTSQRGQEDGRRLGLERLEGRQKPAEAAHDPGGLPLASRAAG